MKYKYLIILFWVLFIIGNLYLFYYLQDDYEDTLDSIYDYFYPEDNIEEGFFGRRRRGRKPRRRQGNNSAPLREIRRRQRKQREEVRGRQRQEKQRKTRELRRIQEEQKKQRLREEEEKKRIQNEAKMARLKEERFGKYMKMFLEGFDLENKKYSTQDEMADFLSSEEGLGNTVYYEDAENNISKTLTFNKGLFISFFTTIRNTDLDDNIDIMKFKIDIPENFIGRCLGFNGIYYCGDQAFYSKDYIPGKDATITISAKKSRFNGKWKFYGNQKPFLGNIVKSIYLSYFPCNINNELYYFKQNV